MVRTFALFVTSLAVCHADIDPALEAAGRDLEIRFNREITLKVTPPCTLSSEGSKLTAYPQKCSYEDFVKSVTWENGLPGYFTKPAAAANRDFNFDLTQKVTFNQEVVVRIIRTTMITTTEGIIIVSKGSRVPTTIRSQKPAKR